MGHLIHNRQDYTQRCPGCMTLQRNIFAQHLEEFYEDYFHMEYFAFTSKYRFLCSLCGIHLSWFARVEKGEVAEFKLLADIPVPQQLLIVEYEADCNTFERPPRPERLGGLIEKVDCKERAPEWIL